MANESLSLSADEGIDFFTLMVIDIDRAAEKLKTELGSTNGLDAGVLAIFLNRLALDTLVTLAEDGDDLKALIADYKRATAHTMATYRPGAVCSAEVH